MIDSIAGLFVGWLVSAFLIFGILELTIPAGVQLKEEFIYVLHFIYLPLYLIGFLLMLLDKISKPLRDYIGGREE